MQGKSGGSTMISDDFARRFFDSLLNRYREALSALRSCLCILCNTRVSPFMTIGVACFEDCSPSTALARSVNSIFGCPRLPESPKLATGEVSAAPKDHEAMFKYSKSLVSLLLLRNKIAASNGFKCTYEERQDALIMAVVVFLQIIYNIHRSCLNDWDHSSLASRVAIAVSSDLAAKFVMDDHPYGSAFFLSMIMNRDEVEENFDLIMHHIVEYQLVVIDKISLYRCSLNHKSWASAFLEVLHRRREISTFSANRVQEILFFIAFNLCEFLPTYSDEREETVAEALVVLSIQCTQNGMKEACLTKSTVLCPSDSYTLAATMGHSIADKSVEETQFLLGGIFVDKTEWQHRATTPQALRRSAYDMQRKAALALTANREK